jgi:hypothetical protein
LVRCIEREINREQIFARASNYCVPFSEIEQKPLWGKSSLGQDI